MHPLKLPKLPATVWLPNKEKLTVSPSQSEKERVSESLLCLSSLLGQPHDVETPNEANVLRTHKTLFDMKILPCL